MVLHSGSVRRCEGTKTCNKLPAPDERLANILTARLWPKGSGMKRLEQGEE
ncbi:hypothetical protein ZHAS_00012285 [Anopheles sinensis]|uniref:Uncharacterized protein n=1 Tax=Anopheles sinensis TaxID=74873 RepID=A0A084W2A2_ANOSI|nr:hypothetical protein ZHAS_00012285 [Anopheles sinensis]